MGFGLVAQIADLFCDHAAQQGKPQIGAHGLGHGDPVIARRPFHRFIALIDDHRNRLIVGRVDGFAAHVVAVPAPIGAARNADGVDAQPIAGGFDQVGGVLWIQLGLLRIRVPVLQQHKRPKRAALRHGGRGFAHVMPVLGAVLQGFAHVAKLGAGEHVCAFGHAGDVGFVDIGGWGVNALEVFERVGAVDKAPFAVRHRVLRVFDHTFAKGPRCAKGGTRLLGSRNKGQIDGEFKIGGDRGQSKPRADIGMGQCTVFNGGKACRDGQFVQINIGI